MISIDVSSRNEKDVFLEVALRSPAPRKLIIWSFDHYPSADAHDDLRFLDRELAKRDVVIYRNSNDASEKREKTVAKYEIKAGHGTNIIIGSRLKDSVHHLSTQVSAESAKLLESIADCVEASGSSEAGEVFDKLSEELKKEDKSSSTIGSYVRQLFDYIPDLIKIGKTVQDTVGVLTGIM